MPDFGDAGFNAKRCIPCAAVCRVKAQRLSRFRIGEAGVDEAGMGHAMNELCGAERTQPAFLGDQAPAGRSFNLGKQRQFLCVVG